VNYEEIEALAVGNADIVSRPCRASGVYDILQ